MAFTCRLAYTDYLRIQHMELLFTSSRSSAFSRLQHLVLLQHDHLKSQIIAKKSSKRINSLELFACDCSQIISLKTVVHDELL